MARSYVYANRYLPLAKADNVRDNDLAHTNDGPATNTSDTAKYDKLFDVARESRQETPQHEETHCKA